MIKLINRERALKNEVFASFIASWQQRFDPRQHPLMTEAGNYFDWEVKTERFYSQSEIDELNHQELTAFLEKKDRDAGPLPDYQGELKYNLNERELASYPRELGRLLQKLSEQLEAELVFVLDYSIPWLSQKNDYAPVQRALDYLSSKGTTADFVGAYQLSGDDLAEFTAHLFWIIRCNASLPYCWFSTDRHEFAASVCKYGNLHLHTYSPPIKALLESFAEQQGLVVIDRCVEAFSTEGGLAGRTLLIPDED